MGVHFSIQNTGFGECRCYTTLQKHLVISPAVRSFLKQCLNRSTTSVPTFRAHAAACRPTARPTFAAGLLGRFCLPFSLFFFFILKFFFSSGKLVWLQNSELPPIKRLAQTSWCHISFNPKPNSIWTYQKCNFGGIKAAQISPPPQFKPQKVSPPRRPAAPRASLTVRYRFPNFHKNESCCFVPSRLQHLDMVCNFFVLDFFTNKWSRMPERRKSIYL